MSELDWNNPHGLPNPGANERKNAVRATWAAEAQASAARSLADTKAQEGAVLVRIADALERIANSLEGRNP